MLLTNAEAVTSLLSNIKLQNDEVMMLDVHRSDSQDACNVEKLSQNRLPVPEQSVQEHRDETKKYVHHQSHPT